MAIESTATKQHGEKFIIRFPNEDRRAAMKVRAAQNRRTMNAEILYLIEKGMEAVDGERNAR